jgi:hypothetical protein
MKNLLFFCVIVCLLSTSTMAIAPKDDNARASFLKRLQKVAVLIAVRHRP